MKRFTFIIVTAVLAVISLSAQPLNRKGVRPEGKLNVQRVMLAKRSVMQGKVAAAEGISRKAQRAKNQVLRAQSPAKAYGVVNQPQGTLYELKAAFNAIAYNWLSGYYDASTDASPMKVVEGTDGNLYISNLVPSLYATEYYWVKAEAKGDGKYVIKKQPIGYYGSEGYEELDYVARLEMNEEGTSYIESENSDINITWKDGVLSTDIDMQEGDYVYGVIYEDYVSDESDELTWEWGGSANWNLKASIMTEEYITPPAGAKVEDMILEFVEGDTKSSKNVKVAFVDDKVYVQSYENVPGWYVGTISGNKVTFEGNQFLGLDEYYNSYQYLTTATVEEAYDEEYDETYFEPTIASDIVFDYDAATKTLTAPKNTAMYINGSTSRIYYAEAYVAPKLYFFKEVAATPADPVITYFWDYDEAYASAELDFNIPTFDTEGNYITPEKLSYQVYVDNEVFTFEKDEYEALDKDYTVLPYGFTDNEWIAQSYLCLFFQPAENVGLQSIYTGGGEEHRSNIVYYNIETGETEVVSGIKSVGASNVKGVAREAYYDATGRQVNADAKGFVIKSVTFADGSKKNFKVVRK